MKSKRKKIDPETHGVQAKNTYIIATQGLPIIPLCEKSCVLCIPIIIVVVIPRTRKHEVFFPAAFFAFRFRKKIMQEKT